jgi:hypothetical protein
LTSHILSKNLKIKTYKTIILPVVLYGHETWSLTVGEEQRLRVLRKIFGPKREEVVGGWRRPHNEELHNLYASPNTIRMIKSRRMGWMGDVAHMGDEKSIQNFGWENLKGRDHMEDLSKDGRIILEWIL